MSGLRILSVGLGPIGLETARLVRERPGCELVGAVDVDPEKRGRDLGELLGESGPSGLAIGADLEAALAATHPDVAVICTVSSVPAIEADLLVCAAAGVGVVTPCEELVYPWLAHPRSARRIDEAARDGGATVLGAGVNPGFVLDLLPAILSGACRSVTAVRASRVLDAAQRRLPLQRKVGAGLSVEEFTTEVAAGRLGHRGMRESVALVAKALGFDLDEITQEVEPVVADRELRTGEGTVAAGRVAGIRNLGFGRRGGDPLVELRLEMYLGARRPRDEIRLEGDPPLRLIVEGGVPGDAATAALLLNWAPRVARAEPGLKTVLDLPPPFSTAG